MKRILFILWFAVPLYSGGGMIAPNKTAEREPFVFVTPKPEKVTAFAAVQTSTQVTATSTQLVITTASTGAGNLVVVHIFHRTGTTGTVTSITDNQSNAYVIGSPFDGNGRTYQAYGVQTTGGVTTITVNFSSSGLHYAGADEYSGFSVGATNAGVYDVRTTGIGTGTSLSVSTLTPAATGELIVATVGVLSATTFTAGTNYTLYNGASSRMQGQYRLSGASSETAPMTTAASSDWDEVATAFKVGAAAAPTSKFFFKP